jgi:uncharacterized membrane protein
MNIVHLHLLLNHLPVVGTVFGILILGAAWVWRSAALARAGLATFVLLAIVGAIVFLTGEPAEELVEGLPGVAESAIEIHEEVALAATVALGLYGLLALGALIRYRTAGRAIPRTLIATAFLLALVPAGAMGYTANLGGQIRHTEIRDGSAATPAAEEIEEEH